MKNMGFSHLRLVSPAALDEEIVRARLVHAGEIWEQARIFNSLEEAVQDRALVIGVTRRRGRRRKALSMTPAEAAAFLETHPGPGALVFGNERTGLEDRELEICNLASHIPADEAFPSLNLSHAVQIYCYEIFRVLGPAREVAGAWAPLERPGVDALVKSVTGSLESLGFYRQRGREEQELFFRDVFARAGITVREARYLANIFAKAAALARGKNEED
jgi:tRNA/rRNA methyltransferase/tRNA (cytidine32/uridine32-2'-O)-methyltransferase